jgi:anaerobic selenocysteine-containing dehydrogenase
MTNTSDIGLVGLAVMGENLVLNMESKGFSVSVYNRTTEVTDKFAAGRAKGILGTVRSHDQWNTTIYSDDDRYRGVKNLRTLVFMNENDMQDRGIRKYDLVDLTSFAKDGSTRHLAGYRAISYNLPRGCAMGYMPEMNILCPIGD